MSSYSEQIDRLFSINLNNLFLTNTVEYKNMKYLLDLEDLKPFLILTEELEKELQPVFSKEILPGENGWFSYEDVLRATLVKNDFEIKLCYSPTTKNLVAFKSSNKDFKEWYRLYLNDLKPVSFHINVDKPIHGTDINFDYEVDMKENTFTTFQRIAKYGGFELENLVTIKFTNLDISEDLSVTASEVTDKPKIKMSCGCSTYSLDELKYAFGNRWVPTRKLDKERGALFHALGLFYYPGVKVKKNYNRKVYKQIYLALFNVKGNFTYKDKQACKNVIKHLKTVHKG